ncbi:MAG: hypothetical protein GOU97_02525 [Nanoarchaeota archaeon]|nr:hypothetical protein [Nanoarchaeota archaeon]
MVEVGTYPKWTMYDLGIIQKGFDEILSFDKSVDGRVWNPDDPRTEIKEGDVMRFSNVSSPSQKFMRSVRGIGRYDSLDKMIYLEGLKSICPTCETNEELEEIYSEIYTPFEIQENRISGIRMVKNEWPMMTMEPYFSKIADGDKTVDVRSGRFYGMVKPGDTLRFLPLVQDAEGSWVEDCSRDLKASVIRTKHYPSFEKALKKETLKRTFPGVRRVDKGVRVLRGFPGYINKEWMFDCEAFEIELV